MKILSVSTLSFVLISLVFLASPAYSLAACSCPSNSGCGCGANQHYCWDGSLCTLYCHCDTCTCGCTCPSQPPNYCTCPSSCPSTSGTSTYGDWTCNGLCEMTRPITTKKCNRVQGSGYCSCRTTYSTGHDYGGICEICQGDEWVSVPAGQDTCSDCEPGPTACNGLCQVVQDSSGVCDGNGNCGGAVSSCSSDTTCVGGVCTEMVAGCYDTPGATSCSAFNDDGFGCTSQLGCTWNPGTCSGSCNCLIFPDLICNSVLGCSLELCGLPWSPALSGDSEMPPGETLYLRASIYCCEGTCNCADQGANCDFIPGCSISGRSCTGTATSCSGLGDIACNRQDGCTWNDGNRCHGDSCGDTTLNVNYMCENGLCVVGNTYTCSSTSGEACVERSCGGTNYNCSYDGVSWAWRESLPLEATNCDDGIDNDCDGEIDCLDDNCFSDPLCASISPDLALRQAKLIGPAKETFIAKAVAEVDNYGPGPVQTFEVTFTVHNREDDSIVEVIDWDTKQPVTSMVVTAPYQLIEGVASSVEWTFQAPSSTGDYYVRANVADPDTPNNNINTVTLEVVEDKAVTGAEYPWVVLLLIVILVPLVAYYLRKKKKTAQKEKESRKHIKE